MFSFSYYTILVKVILFITPPNYDSYTLTIGQELDLQSSLDKGSAANQIDYTSDNPKVASVEKAGGLVKGLKAGTANITCTTYNEKTAVCKITVVDALAMSQVTPAPTRAPITPSWVTIPANTYYIRNVSSGRYLNVVGSKSANKTNINIYDLDYTAGEQYSIREVNGAYSLEPACAPGKAVNVYANSVTSGKNVCVWDYTGNASQTWVFEASGGAYVIRSSDNTDCVLTATGSEIRANVNVQTYKGGSNQQWELIPVGYMSAPTPVPMPTPVPAPDPTPMPMPTPVNPVTPEPAVPTQGDVIPATPEPMPAPITPAPVTPAPTAEPSRLKLSGFRSIETPHAQGSRGPIYGTVSSNYDIVSVRVTVTNSSGKDVFKPSVSLGNTKSYDIRPHFNNELMISELPLGNYVIRVYAMDKSMSSEACIYEQAFEIVK